MPKTIEEFEIKAVTKEVRAEIQAQFAAMAQAGIAISHVDNHMGSLYGIATGRSHLPYVLRECAKRRLPFRLPRYIAAKDELLNSIPNAAGTLSIVTAFADLVGCRIPDYLLSHSYDVQPGETYERFKQMLITKIYDLPEGVSEIYIHPAVEDEEMKAKVPSWEKRVWEYRLMLDSDFAYALRDAGVILNRLLLCSAISKGLASAGIGEIIGRIKSLIGKAVVRSFISVSR